MRTVLENIVFKFIVSLIVITMISTNLIFVIKTGLVYATDGAETNNKNVKIACFFENSNGEKVLNLNSPINSKDLKLVTQIRVEENNLGGYFDGKIELGNSNFRFTDETQNIHVEAGETKTIERPIEYLENDNLNLGYLSMQSEVKLTGKYTNSKKTYDINGNANVQVVWISQDNVNAKLNTEVLTNSIYKINNENRRIVQLLIHSKLENNSYPVQKTEISLSVPDGVETAKVHKRNTMATNGDTKELNGNYKIAESGNTINVNIENNEENGKFAWAKNSEDLIVVTYIFTKDASFTQGEINVNSKITTYDSKQLTGENKVNIKDEKDGIITSDTVENENEIYKGKIYSKEARNYTSTNKINIDYIDCLNKVRNYN